MPKKKNVFSARALAREYETTDSTIRRATERKELFRIKKGVYAGKYDIADERNILGLQLLKNNLQTGSKRPRTNKTVIKKKQPKAIKRNESILDIEDNEEIKKNDLTEKGIQYLDNIVDISDLRVLKEREAIREKQLKNREMRGELVDRKNVSFVFNKLWSIDSSQLTTLGSKLSPEIASICKVDDSKIIAKIRETIDKEIYKTLGHCKRLLTECLGKIGADNLEEENENKEE